MDTVRTCRDMIGQGAIILCCLLLISTFVSLGVVVAKKNVTGLMGTYDLSSTVYFTQIGDIDPSSGTVREGQAIESPGTSEMADVNQASQESAKMQQAQTNSIDEQKAGVNKLAMVLEKKLENKAQIAIRWCIEKITIGLEYIAGLLSKALQSN